MGIFDFLKGSGEEVEVDTGEAVDLELQNLMQGNAIARTVLALGLPVENLRVEYADGVATVHGAAPSQADAEKTVLAVGNTKGNHRPSTMVATSRTSRRVARPS